MGGAFSHGKWQLSADDVLRRRFVSAVGNLFPGQRSFQQLDDELSFSLLDREGAGLVSEQALHDLVHKCGFKMERWQLLYLLARLDTDGDGYIGFADFVLFMHGQDPKVAQKRGVRGPAAINVALASQHLQGPNAKVGDPATAGAWASAGLPSSPLGASTGSLLPRLPTRPKTPQGSPIGGNGGDDENISLLDNQAQVSEFTSPVHPNHPSSGFDFRHDNGLGFGGSGSLAAAAALAVQLPPQPKRHMRVKRGELAGFERYRSPRLAATSPHGQRGEFDHGGAATARLGTGVLPDSTSTAFSGSAAFGASNGAASSAVGSNKTVNGVRVPCARCPYRGDHVRRLAGASAAQASAADAARLLTYAADAFTQQDLARARRVALEQDRRASFDANGRAVSGRAVVWRTDAGEISLGPPGEGLVPTGPVYWDPSRQHLHQLAFAHLPPPLGRPHSAAHASAHAASGSDALGRGRLEACPATAAWAHDGGGSAKAATAQLGSPPSPMLSPQWPAQPQLSPSGAAEGEWWKADERAPRRVRGTASP